MKRARSPIAIVFTIILVDVLGVGILIPIIPLLLTDPTYAYHIGGLTSGQGFITLGWLLAMYPLMQFLTTPLLGQLSDHVGRRPVLAFSLLGTSLGYVAFAIGIITQNLPLLFFSRAFDGITGSTVSVAQAAIADSSTPQNRTRAFGLIGAAFGIGFIIGPFLGGKLSDPSLVSWFNATTPFWFAAIIAFLNSVAVFMFFEETLKQKTKDAFRFTQSLINIKTAVLDAKLRKLFSVSFFFQAGFSFFTSFFGAWMIYRFAFTQGNIGDFFALIGICIAITQGFVTGRVAKRFAPHTVLMVTLFVISLTILGYAIVPYAWMLYVIIPFQALAMGLTMANLTSIISRSADAQSQGRILGINASVQALAQALPPIIAGYVAATYAPNTPILIGAVSVFVAWAILVFFTRNLQLRKLNETTVSA